MGGRGSSVSGKSNAINWAHRRKNPTTILDKDPIGDENKKMFKDTMKNIVSIYPIEHANEIDIKTVKGALGQAGIGLDVKSLGNGQTQIQGYITLAFDDETFSSEYALEKKITDNFENRWNSSGEINHIIAHELGHILDFQLSIKKNGNISLDEFLTAKVIPDADVNNEINRMVNLYDVNFSRGIAQAVSREMNVDGNKMVSMVSEYARESEMEFFAEAFAKSYLARGKEKEDVFVQAFNKVLKERINKL